MGFFGNLFHHKKGGTFVGNLIRGAVRTYTAGFSDAAGFTDGHMVDGDQSNGEYHY